MIIEIPEHLRSSYDLLTRAFPEGIAPELFQPLLIILQEHLSHRNLATLAAILTGGNENVVYNEVLAAAAIARSLEEVKTRLDQADFLKWVNETA